MDAILKPNNVLLVLSPTADETLLQDFFGTVIVEDVGHEPYDSHTLSGKTVYVAGDVSKLDTVSVSQAARIFVIKEVSCMDNDTRNRCWPQVHLGRVPLNMHGLGVFYRQYFPPTTDYFHHINCEHTFQQLSQSLKPQKAHRTGIYLTAVKVTKGERHFRLLRCSTNLTGPTDNFRATDNHIVGALNQEAGHGFSSPAQLNHVLAQVYGNTASTTGQKQAKARISAHADKTKDMPPNAIMGFVTFYKDLEKLRPLTSDPWDYGYKNVSGLTKLRFRLKKSVVERDGLPSQFAITLYPNSVFLMPLSTNRLYTHEIQASELDAQFLPKRLGYVVRSSAMEAVHDGRDTFMKIGLGRVKLEPSTPEGVEQLQDLYTRENKYDTRMEYGPVDFSMNEGDYMAPIYNIQDDFPIYHVQAPVESIFQALDAVTRFEVVGKGREGAVLVKAREGHFPIVRTTTQYETPAQKFQLLHTQLSQAIRSSAAVPVEFNNVLAEKYTSAYTSMGFHSDQALDLANSSYIAVYSCYENPAGTTRVMVVEEKSSGNSFEIPMKHNSVIVFSTETNERFRHKIVLPRTSTQSTWLGLTYRTSKTHVIYRDGKAYFEGGKEMTLADDAETRQFYALRRCENQSTNDFSYPEVSYTISKSDLAIPETVDKDSGL